MNYITYIGRRATLSVQTATRRDGGGGGVTTGSYPNHQRYGGSGHTTTTKTEKDGPSGTADSEVGGAETKRSQDSSEYGERRTSGANGHTSRTKSRRSGHGENDDGAGANATDGGDTNAYTQTSESEARASTAGRHGAQRDADGAWTRAGARHDAPGVANARTRTAGPVLEAGAQHHHGRGGGADCRSAYGDNGGSGGDGEADGGRGEKEGEDGTTSYGGDDGGENGGSEGGSRRHCADGAGDGRAARKAPHPAGRNDEEAVEELHTRK
jgi:hypothetical protein